MTEDLAFAVGQHLRSEANNNAIIGIGISSGAMLLNNVENSLMVGFNSSVPTLFVGPSDGAGTFGNVGIGDITAPTEVLDVNGTARLRVMQDTVPQVLITGLQADTTLGDYVLHYRPFPNDSTMFLAGDGTWQTVNNGADCDWELVNGDLDIVMGYDTACVVRAVGIGTPTPRTKLQVDFDGPLPTGFEDVAIDAIARTTNDEQMTDRIAVRGTSLNEDEEFIANSYGGFFTAYGGGKTYGLFAESFRSPTLNISTTHIGAVGKAADVTNAEDADNIGVQGLASNAYLNCGVKGESSYAAILGGSTPMWGFGVQGIACGANRNFGVYGLIPSTCSSGTNYAGYFEGDVYTTGLYLPSDESLKSDIEDFAGGLDLINQLNPKTYQYDNESYANMNLPSGNQYGLIAGELQEVLPNLTRTVVSPGEKDEEGNVIFPEVEFTGVNYTGLVPILVAAVKEQQTIIESQNEVLAQMMEQLANMQQQINQCCNASDDSKSMPGGAIQTQDLSNQKSIDGGNELYQNIPNPFRESTTISYQLETGGRVQLAIYDGNGKVVTTLVDANQENGRYSEVWNANGMPAGVYHYALYVDGELLVKRAIKLQE